MAAGVTASPEGDEKGGSVSALAVRDLNHLLFNKSRACN
jgi:hypothetical protein